MASTAIVLTGSVQLLLSLCPFCANRSGLGVGSFLLFSQLNESEGGEQSLEGGGFQTSHPLPGLTSVQTSAAQTAWPRHGCTAVRVDIAQCTQDSTERCEARGTFLSVPLRPLQRSCSRACRGLKLCALIPMPWGLVACVRWHATCRACRGCPISAWGSTASEIQARGRWLAACRQRSLLSSYSITTSGIRVRWHWACGFMRSATKGPRFA